MKRIVIALLLGAAVHARATHDEVSAQCTSLLPLRTAEVVSFHRHRLQVIKPQEFEKLGFASLDILNLVHLGPPYGELSPWLGAEVIIESPGSPRQVGRIIDLRMTSFHYINTKNQLRVFDGNNSSAQVFAKPNEIPWHASQNVDSLKSALHQMHSPFIMLNLHADHKGRMGVLAERRHLLGHIKPFPQENLFKITTPNGIEHVLDFSLLTEGSFAAFVTESENISVAEFDADVSALQIVSQPLSPDELEANERSYHLFEALKDDPTTLIDESLTQEPILLLPPLLILKLSKGTVLWDILGERYVTGVDKIPLITETRETKIGTKQVTDFGLIPDPHKAF